MAIDYDAVADLDVVPAILSRLRVHPRVLAGFGEGHVSGTNRAPYPHVQVVASPGGRPPDGVYFDWPELSLMVWSAPDGTPGKAALKRLANTVLAVVVATPEDTAAAPDPAAPVVIAEARASSPWRHATDPRDPAGGGQQSWAITVACHAHAVYG